MSSLIVEKAIKFIAESFKGKVVKECTFNFGGVAYKYSHNKGNHNVEKIGSAKKGQDKIRMFKIDDEQEADSDSLLILERKDV